MLSASAGGKSTQIQGIVLATVLFWLSSASGLPPVVASDPPLMQGKLVADNEPLSPLQKGMQPRGFSGVYKDKVTPHWFADDTQFWYRNDLKGRTKEFIRVDAEKGTRGPAFDHGKLASALSGAAGTEYKADSLPFEAIEFSDNAKAIQFDTGGKRWKCDLNTYACTETGPSRKKSLDSTQPPAFPVEETQQTESPWVDDGPAEQPIRFLQPPQRRDANRARAPDGKSTAIIKDYNVVIQNAEGKDIQLTKDGKEGLAYGRLEWSPDSKSLVAFRVETVERKEVYLIESSPPGGGRAIMTSRPYELPGDKFPTYELHVFNIEMQKDLPIDDRKIALAESYESPRPRWGKDGHTFTLQRTERGHQRFRLVEINAHTGESRNLIDEKTDTFIWTAHTENINIPMISWLQKTDEIIYVSEKSGWRHLHLIDVKTGRETNEITQGEFVVRGVDRIDEEKRQVWFRASGKRSDQDPYFVHYYRVNFDGAGLVDLTEGDGSHTVAYSPNRRYIIDSYSRVDMAPVTELRRVEDGKLVCKLEESDIADLKANGWKPLEVFSAKGRDGKTDIWGVIARPRNFDPSKKYPVLESIYAGPQGAFVPKTFSAFNRYASLTDLGFIVVQIDGMGTANRSKAFHDTCWKNLKDAGFSDRVLWHQAVASKHPYYDVSRVGIYGTSAGGQNAMGALLFAGDFYKAAVAACGCHDNRMDKASWNEQWMGYPVGPQYAASSNVDNAKRLTGKLLLIVGEKDTNVPPESTMRVVDALIKAGKDFDLLVVPGMGHSNGGSYGTRRMQDFFVRHLQGVEPPDRNAAAREDRRRQAVDTPLQQPEPPIVAPPPHLKVARIDVAAMIRKPANEAVVASRRYDIDRGALMRTYFVVYSPARTERLRKFATDWLAALNAVDNATLSPEAREELASLRSKIEDDLKEVNRRAGEADSIAPLIPFAATIVDLEESRRRIEQVDSVKAADRIDALRKQVEKLRAIVDGGSKSNKIPPELTATKWSVTRAAEATDSLRANLRTWHSFYSGYDPEFTWWLAEPYRLADVALNDYSKSLRSAAKVLPDVERTPSPQAVMGKYPGPSDAPDLAALFETPRSELAGALLQYGRGRTDSARWLNGLKEVKFDELTRPAKVDYLLFKAHLQREAKRQEFRASGVNRSPLPKDDIGISVRPIGRDALMAELAGELIPYTPEELIAIARAELAWCDAEMLKASRAMGFGDDWRAALEKVKRTHVKPGEQPRLIRDLSVEAIDYLKKNELVSLPPLAEETWRMIMMTPERQLVNPFFTGGEVISVSFPTNTMSHEAKLQSLRGNNIPFARATVHHELIPGHHLQLFMNARCQTQRGMFGTPFSVEGWALYWELVLYDKGFPKSPEDKIGFLTWRKHRCARIIFSLSYHMGSMTPRECVALLTDRVGFEPENSVAEVRRSFGGGYAPLYQAAYLLGGFQYWELRKELVGAGMMTDRQFHDAILREHSMPVAMVRAILKNQPLNEEGLAPWRFRQEGAVSLPSR